MLVMSLYNQFRMWLATREDGQDLIEYALLVAFIAIVAVVAVNAAGGAVSHLFDGVATALGNIEPTVPELPAE